MPERYIITADRARLRIYRYSQEPGQLTPSIQPVDALDLQPAKKAVRTETPVTDDSFSPAAWSSPPIDHRADGEHEKRAVGELAGTIEAFLSGVPHADWNFAAPSVLGDAILDNLSDPARRKLDQVVSKDLVNAPPAELRQYFELE
jgi:Protein required for attachment to host cells